jgi:phosphatidylserine/phosphatidylglycerophosphate/cardiolipin synthase-like enzyme
MTITGPAVLDIIQHFVERWNEIKTRKVSVRLCITLGMLYLM